MSSYCWHYFWVGGVVLPVEGLDCAAQELIQHRNRQPRSSVYNVYVLRRHAPQCPRHPRKLSPMRACGRSPPLASYHVAIRAQISPKDTRGRDRFRRGHSTLQGGTAYLLPHPGRFMWCRTPRGKRGHQGYARDPLSLPDFATHSC